MNIMPAVSVIPPCKRPPPNRLLADGIVMQQFSFSHVLSAAAVLAAHASCAAWVAQSSCGLVSAVAGTTS